MNIGAAIKQARKEKRITQMVLSKKTGISQTALSQIEVNDNWPHKSTLIKITKALNISLACLLILSLEEKDVPAKNRALFNVHSQQMLQLLNT